jgi:hypothetical protein
MSPDRREILERVARGELTPEEADALLGGAELPPPADATIRKVKVSAGVGGIEVVGDPSVAQAEIDGPHQAELRDDTLVVRAEIDPSRRGAFAISLGRRGKLRLDSGGGRVGGHPVSRLRIRMNPALELDAGLDAGPLSISGMKGPIRARVAAGPITIDEFEGPLDVSVNAGAVRAMGKLTYGESRIRSDAGAVKIVLEPDSSVHIIANAALGKVVVPGSDQPKTGRFGSDRREATLGNGDATLRVETAMGSVHIASA